MAANEPYYEKEDPALKAFEKFDEKAHLFIETDLEKQIFLAGWKAYEKYYRERYSDDGK